MVSRRFKYDTVCTSDVLFPAELRNTVLTHCAEMKMALKCPFLHRVPLAAMRQHAPALLSMADRCPVVSTALLRSTTSGPTAGDNVKVAPAVNPIAEHGQGKINLVVFYNLVFRIGCDVLTV